VKEKLERACQRWPWFGWVMRVQNRYSELNGNYLAAAVTLAGFLSLFPLLLVALAVLGFVAAGRVDLAGDVISRMGLTGDAATFVTDLIRQTERSRHATNSWALPGWQEPACSSCCRSPSPPPPTCCPRAWR
jgi:membrane protein